MNVILGLAAHFSLISLIAFGGASSALPEMHRYLVDTMHWLTDSQFVSLYAISQAAPGPNVLFVALFGWQAAGVPGALASLVAMCGPSSVLSLCVERFGRQYHQARWHGVIRRALAPLTISLLLASVTVFVSVSDTRIGLLLLSFGTVLLGLTTRLSFLWFIAGGAILGALGWV